MSTVFKNIVWEIQFCFEMIGLVLIAIILIVLGISFVTCCIGIILFIIVSPILIIMYAAKLMFGG